MSNTVTVNGFNIGIEFIKDIIDHKQSIVTFFHLELNKMADERYRDLERWGLMIPIKDKKEFNMIKFSYISHIKKREDPRDRVAHYECLDSNLITDFNKLEKLIETRKTREEKNRELKEEIELKKVFDKKRIKYYGPLSS